MIILGIDPGLANTGWGIVETRGTECRCRAYGCIHTDTSENTTLRLHRIYTELNVAIARYEPTEAAIEEIFMGANHRSVVATAQARGAILVACSNGGLEVGEYTPMQIKMAVTGTGTADKSQVQYMVRTLLRLEHEPKPDHCADALAAAICHAHLAAWRQTGREHGLGDLHAGSFKQRGTRL